jgi:ribosomal protein L11 methylase PrmA
MPSEPRIGGSFRDPSGFLFKHKGEVFRQVNSSYRQEYELFKKSGLYKELTDEGLLISHREVNLNAADPRRAYKILKPTQLEFITYPYEWSFSQLKDAALLTLELQKRALVRRLWLKDAATTNIQFHGGRPMLVDSLSFEAYPEGQPWVAYRQFCQHFLAPLALMTTRDVRLSQLLRVHTDGIPLDLASRLLPWQTRLNLGLLTHIHLHAAAQERYAGKAVPKQQGHRGVSKIGLLGLIDNLERTVRGLHWKPAGTAWGDYTCETSYSQKAAKHKKQIVSEFIDRTKAKTLWDLGANVGLYSRLASQRGIFTVAVDSDPAAVELNYLQVKKDREQNLLPVTIDLTNPSASIGWANEEQQSLIERGPADAIMALALIHHFAIANNVPMDRVAKFFGRLGAWLIIEFVPKSDPQVQRLLAARKDIFTDFHLEGFRAAFKRHYRIVAESAIRDSERRIFLLRRSG